MAEGCRLRVEGWHLQGWMLSVPTAQLLGTQPFQQQDVTLAEGCRLGTWGGIPRAGSLSPLPLGTQRSLRQDSLP